MLQIDSKSLSSYDETQFVEVETGEARSVLYKGFASELFVPYMDPGEGWYSKAYMDAGEFGLGPSSMPLVPLNDCPRNAYYIDGFFASPEGIPILQPNMICLFERYAGDTSWRHSEILLPGVDVMFYYTTLLLFSLYDMILMKM